MEAVAHPQLAAQFLLEILGTAGMPPRVINLVSGHGTEVSDVVLQHPEFAGLHFTGSTRVFQQLWQEIGSHLSSYRHYPRIVGETGGKDFILAHPSADPEVVRTAMIRGAFEYQGQKCSAASRAFIPRSVWKVIHKDLVELTEGLTMGDVTDLSNFMGAVIDDRAFARHKAAIERAKGTSGIEVVAGGTYDDSEGWFVRPTIMVGQDPHDEIFTTEYFGPLLSVHVYPDRQFDRIIDTLDSVPPTPSPARHRPGPRRRRRGVAPAPFRRGQLLRPTQADRRRSSGATVRRRTASGTNDKAGSAQNLLRWTTRARSRRRSSRRRTTPTPTWA